MNKYAKIMIISMGGALIIGVFAFFASMGMKDGDPTKQDTIENRIKDNGFAASLDERYPINEEELSLSSPYDEDKAKAISSLPDYSEQDTWDIYIYMCGSDLESNEKDSLTDASYFDLIRNDSYNYNEDKDVKTFNRIKEVLEDNGLSLPESFYIDDDEIDNKNLNQNGEEKQLGGASEDLREITRIPLNDKVRIIIQTGGSSSWDFPYVNANKTERFIYDKDGLRKVYSGELENMGDSDTLTSFLLFLQNYEASHKAFIFWDHGEGAIGSEYDEIFNDQLYLTEMRDSFASVYDLTLEEHPFDIVGFDACLMASAEAMYYFKGVADYYIGSEDLEYGGWNHYGWIKALCDNPSMNAAKLGKTIIDSFMKLSYQQCKLYNNLILPNTLSLYDLDKASLVYEEYAILIEQILKDSLYNPSLLSFVTKCSESAIRYGGSEYEYYNTCDLKTFLTPLIPLYEKEVTNILNLMEESLLYTRGREMNKHSSSMNIYFPTSINNLSSLLRSIDYIDNVPISYGLKALYFYKTTGCLDEELTDYISFMDYEEPLPYIVGDMDISFNNDDTFTLSLKDNLTYYIKDAKLNIKKLDEESITYISSLPLEIDGNKITASLLNSGLYLNDELLSISLISQSDDAIRYTSPILLNGRNASLVLSNNLCDKSVTISGFSDNSLESDAMYRNLRFFNKNDKLTPLREKKSGFYLEESFDKGNAISYNDKTQLKFAPLPKGKYILNIELTDLRGDKYLSKNVEVTIKESAIESRKITDTLTVF